MNGQVQKAARAAITMPKYKTTPDVHVSIQSWDTDDFYNSAYNSAILDIIEMLERQGFEVKHEA